MKRAVAAVLVVCLLSATVPSRALAAMADDFSALNALPGSKELLKQSAGDSECRQECLGCPGQFCECKQVCKDTGSTRSAIGPGTPLTDVVAGGGIGALLGILGGGPWPLLGAVIGAGILLGIRYSKKR